MDRHRTDRPSGGLGSAGIGQPLGKLGTWRPLGRLMTYCPLGGLVSGNLLGRVGTGRTLGGLRIGYPLPLGRLGTGQLCQRHCTVGKKWTKLRHDFELIWDHY